MNIYVSNLSFNVQDEDLREFFTEYGEVSSAKVITDKITGKDFDPGLVNTMTTVFFALAVIMSLYVNFFKKKPTPPRH